MVNALEIGKALFETVMQLHSIFQSRSQGGSLQLSVPWVTLPSAQVPLHNEVVGIHSADPGSEIPSRIR
jgi:hypothetical protein